MAKRSPSPKPALTGERRLTATQVAGFIILPLLCMVAMVVGLLVSRA